MAYEKIGDLGKEPRYRRPPEPAPDTTRFGELMTEEQAQVVVDQAVTLGLWCRTFAMERGEGEYRVVRFSHMGTEIGEFFNMDAALRFLDKVGVREGG